MTIAIWICSTALGVIITILLGVIVDQLGILKAFTITMISLLQDPARVAKEQLQRGKPVRWRDE